MKVLSLFFTFSYALDEMLLMMMMQQQQQVAPGQTSQMNNLLPLLLMDSDSGQTKCEPEAVYVQPEPEVVYVQPEPEVQTVFRTWRVNADGTRELIEETTE
ncbi:Oidioi.mRNA.OKI2018_I69.chr2.g6695.t1.cds [Oikopleura dioica]|uniref:Oidioi.mRNA.OKI2018_I69.chr2.g6695.t1.cds n=1 Tax=Oikopleura dioica TaxID=34765 RepID=A0ABN7T656_OIKDI|nr:Oidioi.mRNA.OKI2018_I69.chr2.g6695.t1.cds [Oikopleura dioica]